MTGNGDEFMALENAVVFDNGKRVAFTVKAATGKQLRVHCELPILGDIFAFLGQLAQAGGELRNVPTPPFPQTHNYLAPVPAQGIGLQAGRNPDETLLVVRLTGFDMAFAVPNSGIVRLADDFVRAARTLSGSEEHPN